MSWSSIIGQERIKNQLRQLLKSRQIAHAYLFYGPEGIGKDALAIEFAKAMNCEVGGTEACDKCNNCRRIDAFQHPNIKLVFALPAGKGEKTGDDPVGVLTESQVADVREQMLLKAKDPYHRIEIQKANFIKINSVRDIKREASMSRTEEGNKIFIIFNADMMNAEASNSLLKTLEEPLPGVILLLTTSAKDQLLPTIISRCQLLQCDVLQEAEIESALASREGADQPVSRLAAQLAQGSYGNARRLSSLNMIEERQDVVEFMRLLLSKNRAPLIDAIDELASSSDRPGIERWLRLLQSWLRDALLLQQNAQAPLLDDEKNSMKNFVTKFGHANLIASIQTVEKAIAHLDKNVYLHLVLTILAIDLRKLIMEIPSV
jgi:DNA polymerase III subunit delta'